MSMTISEPPMADTPEHDPSVPDVTLLEDKMPEWFRLPARAAGFSVLMSLTFVFFNLMPLNHTDLWGHLSYGRHIWNTGAIPSTEPLLPLAQGMPFVDSAWLTQLIGYGAYQLAGKAALVFLYATAITLSVGLMVHRVHSRTRSPLVAFAAYLLLMWVNWQQTFVIRPQLAGYALFCLLFVLLTRRTWSKPMWYVIPAMLGLWASLHGSFVMGLTLLGCFTLGRAIDLLRRTGQVKALFHDDRLRRLFLITELSALATLLNPFGLALYAEVLTFGSNPNLQNLVEWHPLNLRMLQGQAAAVCALLLILAYRFSPRRASATELLLLAGLGGGALWSSRLILWWAPVAVYCFAVHAWAAWRQWRKLELVPETPATASLWTLASLGFGLIALEMSPLGGATLDLALGRDAMQRIQRVAVSDMTPVGAAQYLVKHPPEGMVFATYELGDYLLWAGPPDMKLFVASHAHLVTEEVWNDYLTVINQGSGWEDELKRHGIETLVLDEKVRGPLISRLREGTEWRMVFKDDRAAVFKRRTPEEVRRLDAKH